MRILILLSFVLAACGGGATPSGGASETSAPSEPAAASPAAGGATAAPSGDAGPNFADLLRSGKLASYRVSYKMTTTGGGQSGTSEQTWYFKPPKTRLDITGDDGYGGTTKVSMFFLDTGSYLCTEAGGDKSCLQVSAEAAAGQNLGFQIQDSFQDDPAAFSATQGERRNIAGQQAYCYVVRGAAAAFSEGTFCYTQTGIPLLSQWVAGGASFTMEATSFSTTVPDSDFTLPATPQKLP